MANPYEQFGMVGGDGSGAPSAAPSAGSYSSSDLAADMPGLLEGKGTTAASTNPYAQFGTVGQSASGAPDGPEIEDRTDKATISGIAKQGALGLVSGIPNAAAGVADLLEKGTVDALTFSNPVTGENQLKGLGRSLGLIDSPEPKADPYIPTTGQDIRNLSHVEDLPQPQNAPERIARMGGEGAVLMLAPEALAGRLGTLGNAARATVVGTASGVGGQSAAEAVPEKYKPLASLVGGIAGGGIGEGVASIPKAIGSGAKAAADYVAPLSSSGQQRLAGETLTNAATNPEQAISAIDSAPKTIVPGSAPTTFQMTGDPGLGTLERSVATQSPESFIARRAEQNSARLDALNDIQAEGHPEAVSGFFRNQLDDLDKTTQALHDTAEQNARNASADLVNTRTPEAIGEDIKSAVTPQIEQATNAARTASEGIGGGDSSVLGEQARTAIQSKLDEVRAKERALWNSVDPDGTLQTVSSPVKQAVSKIYSDMGPEARLGMAPIEGQIANVVSEYGQTLPFQRLIDLRSAVSQAMRDVRSPLSPNQPAYARLTQLRGAIEDAISDSVAQKAAQEQQAVATGAMRPEETFFQRFAREASEFGDARRTARSRSTEAYFDLGEPNAGRSGISDGEMGEGSASNGAAGRTAGGEGAEGPFLDQETVDRLKAATAATAERKQTYGAKPVSQILQRPGNAQPFTMAPGAVASSIWKAGGTGGDSIRSVLKAAGNNPESVEAIRNMAASSLRSKAENGIVTSRLFNQWRNQHASALQALEEASLGTIQRFRNAASVSDGLNRFENFNPASPSGILPEKYFATGEKGFGTVEELRSLVGKDKADKLMGEYAADSLRSRAMRPDGTLDPKKFEAWQKSHSGALRALPDVQAKFMDAAKASDNLAIVSSQRKDALDAYQKTAAGKVLKVEDPSDVVKTIGSVFDRKDSVAQMKALVAEAGKDPDALMGLRKAIIEHMQNKLVSNTEAGTSGRNLIKSDAFQTFLGKNHQALRQLFNDEELGSMRAIAQDLKRANWSIASSKLPGQSNTAQDLSAVTAHNLKESLLTKIITHAIGGGAGFLGGGLYGSAAGIIGSHLLGGMREAGIRNVEELVRNAMLDPELAKALMMKAPRKIDTGSELTAAARLRRLSAVSSIMSAEKNQN